VARCRECFGYAAVSPCLLEDDRLRGRVVLAATFFVALGFDVSFFGVIGYCLVG
jgi:hypothetical protein